MTELSDFPRQAGEGFGEYWARALSDPGIVDHVGEKYLSAFRSGADFCRRHNVRPGFGEPINLWGYGTVPIAFSAENGDWWVDLVYLAEPTGIDHHKLVAIAEQMADEDDEDTSRVDMNGDHWVLHSWAVVQLFMLYSPWSAEWFAACEPMLTHAMIHSGLLGQIGSAPTYRAFTDADGNTVAVPTGETFADTVTRDLPSEEVALRQALRGPGLRGPLDGLGEQEGDRT